MLYKIFSTYRFSTCCSTILFLASCSKFVEVGLPKDQVQTVTIFTTGETATAAVAGLYAQMLTTNLSITNGGVTIYAGLSADELKNTSPSTDLDAFYNNTIPANNSVGIQSRLWTAAYKYIYQANLILEGLAASKQLSDSVKLNLTAETKFTRAFLYYYMVNFFGDVPLVVATDFNKNAVLPRSSVNVIVKQILDDLQFAYQHLPSTPYPNNARPCRYTAAALLARVYLYNKNWEQAASMASLLIDSKIYQLEIDLSKTFLSTSKETIWQLPKDAGNTVEATTFIPATTSSRPAYVLLPSLISSFDKGDKRFTNWTATKTVSGQPYAYPFKYKLRTASPLGEAYIVIRLAELYAIRAEANARMNKILDATNDINVLRQRAGLLPKTDETGSSIMQTILSEKRKEFFAEWGHRWFDLNRTSLAAETIKNEKGSWTVSAGLFPIPNAEILKNPYLKQNIGY